MEQTAWSSITKTNTGWTGDSLASTTVLVDDPVCLVDDPTVLIDGYDPTQHNSQEKKNTTSWT